MAAPADDALIQATCESSWVDGYAATNLF